MVKRIRCKVVRSVLLGENGCASWQSIGASGANVRDDDNGDLVTYVNRLGVARVSVEGGMAGQILDCYI